MKCCSLALGALVALGAGCGPHVDPTVLITLTHSGLCDNAGAVCFCASPDPAAVNTGQNFQFWNNSTNTYTVMVGPISLATLEPGETSSPLKYDVAGAYTYYAQSCPPTGLHSNSHTINVTGSSNGNGGGGGDGISSGVMITATWSGGAKGPPTDLKAITASSPKGRLAPAGTVLFNYGSAANKNAGKELDMGNTSSQSLMFYACAFAGGGGQSNLASCAVDARETPLTQLSMFNYAPMTPLEPTGVFPAADPAIVVFYCSDATTLFAPPLAATIACR